MQEVGRHNGQKMNTAFSKAQDVITYLWSISYVQTDIAKFKGLLNKIKVIKGFSAKLKVLKVSKGFKGSTRGPVE